MRIKQCFEKQYDPFSLNRILFDSDVYEKLIPPSFGTHVWEKPMCRVWIVFVRELLKIVIRKPFVSYFYDWGKYIALYDKKVVFNLTTKNNLRSLKSVIYEVLDSKGNVFVIETGNKYKCYPHIKMLLLSVFYIPRFFSVFKHLSQREKRITSFFIDHFLTAPGYTWFYRNLLSRCRPESVVMANDHGHDKRAFMFACEEFGIRTIYAQHASVSYAFPPLHFSYSFLDGEDAFRKYTANGKKNSGCIVLLGACRYDNLNSYRLNRKTFERGCIGVAINPMDDVQLVYNLCEMLLNHFPKKRIIVRAHPAMKNHPYELPNNNRLVYTCASDISIIDYLDKIDMQISNDSGVHLDTLLGGVPTVAYNMSKRTYGDNYGYVSSGLVFLAEDEDSLLHFIDEGRHSPDMIECIRMYDESYGKLYSGRCSHIIAGFILNNYNIAYLEQTYYFHRKKLHDDDYCYISR